MHLCGVQRVKALNLISNAIGEMGAEKLAGALPNLVNLTESRPDFLCTERKGYVKCSTPLYTNGYMRSDEFVGDRGKGF